MMSVTRPRNTAGVGDEELRLVVVADHREPALEYAALLDVGDLGAKLWPWIPSGLLRKFRALSIARPNRARQATRRSWTSGWMRTSATSSNTSGATVSRPTSVVPARAPSITCRLRSRVNTSESKRGW